MFSDSADDPVADGQAPYDGEFRPEQPLAVLRGEAIGGRWRLVDPTGLAPVDGLIRVATGLDAIDIAFMTVFGPSTSRRSARAARPGAG